MGLKEKGGREPPYGYIKPISKKESRNETEIFKPVNILPDFKIQNSLNVVCMINLISTLIKYFQNIYTHFEKGFTHSMAH